jgi:hypothetical protein
VAFSSAASNLAPSGPHDDVFVRDLQTGSIELVSKTSLGAFGNLGSNEPSLSGDGRWVAFQTPSSLVQHDPLPFQNVYLHDRLTELTFLVSQTTTGSVAIEDSWMGQVSRDGNSVGFESSAVLAPPAPGLQSDAYVYDRLQAAPWTDLGGGIAGSLGVPVLLAEGPLTGGATPVFALASAPGNAPTVLVAGFSVLNLPFKGGTLVPAPDVLVPLMMPISGKLKLVVHWPAGVPAGTRFWLQAWFADAGAPSSFSSSNTLLATTP